MHKKQLIKKFLRNECSVEEADLAIRWLEEDPSLMDEMLAKKEWDEVPMQALLHPDRDNEMRVHVKTKTTCKPLRRTLIWAAAACIAGVVLTGYFMLFTGHEKQQTVNVATSIEERANHTSSVQKHILADGSVVRLYPGSVIHFHKGLNKNRNIWLKGKADFSVTKNEQKPFAVDAAGILTTALGTYFSVEETREGVVVVNLFEGKVSVKSVAPHVAMDDVYLTPGQRCSIDLKTSAVSVSLRLQEKAKQFSLPAIRQHLPEAIVTETVAAGLDFVKAPVADVFSRIEQVYGIEIEYGIDVSEGAYFTGKLEAGSPIETALDIVCSMNGLYWQKFGDSIKVQRKAAKDSINEVSQEALTKDGAGYINALSATSTAIEVNVIAPEFAKPVTYYVRNDGAILFHKTRLAEALKLLQKTKSFKIHFSDNDIEQIYLTGAVSKDEPLELTLSGICAMNNLHLDVQDEQFVIRRK